MSASPAAPPGGAPSRPAKTLPGPKPKTNPLRSIKRKPIVQRPHAPRPPAASSAGNQSAQQNPSLSNVSHSLNRPAAVPSPQPGPQRSSFVQRAQSPNPEGEPSVCKVIMSKGDFIDGLRYHIARLQARKTVDITDETDYTRPIRLHRRDRGAYQVNGQEGMDVDSKDDLADEKERERQEAIKAERQRIREENAKLIAPTVNAKRKAPAFKKKTEQVYRANDTPEEQKRSLLRYEEALPWHLEDFDNKHVWEGSFQDAFVGSYMLLMEWEGVFHLIPVEKRYNFTEQSKARHQTTLEQAEEMMEKKLKEPRWVTKAHKQQQQKMFQQKEAERSKKLFGRKGGRDEQAGADALDQPEEAADADDIDFNYQEDFADDEENELFEGDEETTKEAEKRIQKEQYGANIFSQNDEKEVDAEEARKKKLVEAEKAAGKRTRKMLRQKGGDYTLYESDTDEGPGGIRESASSSSGSDEEDEEGSKRDEDRKTLDKLKGKDRDGGRNSGASSRGTNTPSGRGKTVDLLKTSTTQAAGSLKRPGSPYLSDASGNESSRKKVKKSHASGAATPSGMPLGDDELPRPASLAPGLPVRRSSMLAGAGSASDTDGNGKKIKIKLNVGRKPGGSRGGTPAESRAGSPGAQGAALAVRNGSQPGSPRVPTPAGSMSALPSPAEILEKVPTTGILLADLTKMFRSRGINATNIKEFAALVRSLTDWDKETKLLRPKPNLHV